MADQADSPDASPMRGRAAEYDTVLSLLAGTAEGQGKILLVEGDPGTGKSLLLAADPGSPGAGLLPGHCGRR